MKYLQKSESETEQEAFLLQESIKAPGMSN
jgi:hypothetical protein